MKLISIQGHFGCFRGEAIAFDAEFCRRILPNGWGKSTLCAFVRVMLYGLNTAKRDTAAALADKTRYVPLDGQAMSGRLTVEHQGRPITIVRTTGRGGPMQDFEAYYEDTREPCDFLNAKNCGETLLGVSEEVFRATSFIDGAELMRPSAELCDRIVSMAQTGDFEARGDAALKQLDRWKLDLDSGNGHGTLPKLEAELKRLDERLREAELLEEEIVALEQRNEEHRSRTAELEQVYEEAYRENAGVKADEQNKLIILKGESERRVASLQHSLPTEEVIDGLSDALFSYEGAAKLEQEKREQIPPVVREAQLALARLDREEKAEALRSSRRQRPRVSWSFLIIGALLACAAAGSAIFGGDPVGRLPYVLSALAVVAVGIAFAGSVKRRKEPVRDFETERAALNAQVKEAEHEQRMAAEVLREAYDALLTQAQSIRPVRTIEEAAELVRDKREDLQALRREQEHLQDILAKLRSVRPGDAASPEGRADLDEKRGALRAAQKELEAGLQSTARLQGHLQTLGSRELLDDQRRELLATRREAREKHADLEVARRIVQEEQAALSARMAPEIARVAAGFLFELTDGALSEVRIEQGLVPRAAGADGRLLGAQQLSSGMRDQLYLAFRLAVCETLNETAPLILDEPFLTFDSSRMARGERLLRELSRKRQVILLTNK